MKPDAAEAGLKPRARLQPAFIFQLDHAAMNTKQTLKVAKEWCLYALATASLFYVIFSD